MGTHTSLPARRDGITAPIAGSKHASLREAQAPSDLPARRFFGGIAGRYLAFGWKSGSVFPSLGTDGLDIYAGRGRLVRGGSWYYSANSCRSADRYSYRPVDWNYDGGFRVVLASGEL